MSEAINAAQHGDPRFLHDVLGEVARDVATGHAQHQGTVAAHQDEESVLVMAAQRVDQVGVRVGRADVRGGVGAD